MKKLLIALVLLLGVSSIYAQDKSAKEYKIEGADAYKAKDYQAGYDAFEKSIQLYEADGKTDTSLYYNVAICAFKIKNYEKAISYFDRSVELGYKACKSDLYKANALKKLGKYDEMVALCESSGAKCPKYKNKFDDLLFKNYLKSGLEIFNGAAKMQADATPLAQSDPDGYTAEMVKVKAKFGESIPLLEKAHSIKPDDETCKNALRQVYELLDMQAKAAAL